MTTGRELTMPDDVRTAAGKRLLEASWSDQWMLRPVAECEAMVAAIEAEARRAALDEAVEAVAERPYAGDSTQQAAAILVRLQALRDATPEPIR